MSDRARIAEALAKMRRPEVRINPVDVARLEQALPIDPDTLVGQWARAPVAGVSVVSDDTVEVGHVWLYDRAMEEMPMFTPTPVEPVVLAELDRMRTRATEMWSDMCRMDWSTIDIPADKHDQVWPEERGADFLALSRVPSPVTVLAWSKPPRRPWKLTGRQRTRKLWARRGRR